MPLGQRDEPTEMQFIHRSQPYAIIVLGIFSMYVTHVIYDVTYSDPIEVVTIKPSRQDIFQFYDTVTHFPSLNVQIDKLRSALPPRSPDMEEAGTLKSKEYLLLMKDYVSKHVKNNRNEHFQTKGENVITSFFKFIRKCNLAQNVSQDIGNTPANVFGKSEFYRYVTFGCKFPTNEDYSYVFYLPLTVKAWLRVGFESVVVLIGTPKQWTQYTITNFILIDLIKMGAILIFLDAAEVNQLSLSQTSRLFVPYLPMWDGKQDTYILTSDADLWPLKAASYYLPDGKSILSLNSECCGQFIHKTKTFKMIPMANIGMSVRTWRNVINMKRNRSHSLTAESIITYFEQEFGDIARKPVHKGVNNGWYMDQLLASKQVATFDEKNRDKHNKSTVAYVARLTYSDRIDRSTWLVPKGNYALKYKLDAHLLMHGYTDKNWMKLRPLLRLMYSKDDIKLCDNYRNRFVKFLANKKV